MDRLTEKLRNKKILIAGFGREGQSTYQYIRKHLPGKEVTIADKDGSLPDKHPYLKKDQDLTLKTGNSYLQGAGLYDIIFKSPGLKFPEDFRTNADITSQSREFLKTFRDQTIGVTGTKGKSTTASLIHHILSKQDKNHLLLGNIGSAPLNSVDEINKDSLIVFELSAHQLEHIDTSPQKAVLLNLFDEHLDYFQTAYQYHNAKLNIARFQEKGDLLIINADDKNVARIVKTLPSESSIVEFGTGSISHKGASIRNGVIYCQNESIIATEKLKLKGTHNIKNTMAAALTCKLLGLSADQIRAGILSFQPLEHRLEYLGRFKGIHFYNDSIATIPEACMEAVRTLKTIDALILGGFDRGLQYDKLVEFLLSMQIGNIICYGQAGKHLFQLLSKRRKTNRLFYKERFNQVGSVIREVCKTGDTCLLSPAAASYDQFKNFEERGRAFKRIAESL
ncbi:MAG: UDP-N-acetylmuramoyl-L-alanine--D-glutamate ligase [Bacteroidales bacterium]|nr:UDP-N-acetylmuramoyl-L-alanine--D-glutamate ligase [Bacteroidales bacterium]MCF8344679.1 UDP-N-acetylmuramoyl-L-alanine--D-glutamate ligase [Bacteroidales bacterium]MCF8351481.1 UDP-N-acetylmuramoyl-L-alanine--D-glutamate ligase [Bacteroidales bacterium]MCF8375702.1 UDP-N-acetylmuramoyl-L-alanine--D-glutamate ligase [Bacteroidales bacterium]MCF8400302.1 UDP-N-acetylmuramoyl-L-alanine--D-glutamate ligase [Bacteroidales bacterium]